MKLIDEFIEKRTLNYEFRHSNSPIGYNKLKYFQNYNAVFIIEESENINRYLTPTFVFIKSLYNSNYVNYKYIGDVVYILV